MKLDYRMRELIAVGTAVGANCRACLEHHVAEARRHAVPEDEIAAAIDVGKAVRLGAQGGMDTLADALMNRPRDEVAAADCGCGA